MSPDTVFFSLRLHMGLIKILFTFAEVTFSHQVLIKKRDG